MDKKLENEIYDVLVCIDEYFTNGSQVYPDSLNPMSVDDETMRMAVRSVLDALYKKGA